MASCRECKWLTLQPGGKTGECTVVKSTDYSSIGMVTSKIIRDLDKDRSDCPNFTPKD
jgi:hypothetical protein